MLYGSVWRWSADEEYSICSFMSDLLKRALAVRGCTENGLFELWNLLRPQESLSNSSFKRKVAKELHWECVSEHQIPNCSAENKLFICRIDSLLRAFCEEVPGLATAIFEAIEKNAGHPLQVILYADETTAGNVVSPNPKLKCNMLYFSLDKLASWDRELIWWPLGLIQTCQVEEMQGDWCDVWNLVLSTVQSMELQNGFLLPAPGGGQFLVPCETGFFLGDFAVLANILGHNGAASLKPCPYCRNICKRHCGLPHFDATLIDITCSDASRFEPMSDEDLLQIRQMLQDAQGSSQAAQDRLQKACGFKPGQQSAFEMSKTLLDSMHILYHNGMLGWEVNRIVQHLCQHTNIKMEDLQICFQEQWKRPLRFEGKDTAYYRRKLIHPDMFKGETYRGLGNELRDLVPLLYHFLEASLRPLDLCIPQLDSLKAASEVVQIYQICKRCDEPILAEKVQEFKEAITKHHVLMIAAYGETAVKPKHHYRYHLANQLLQNPSCRAMDCWNAEKMHSNFKGNLALRTKSLASDSAGFQKSVLKRLLNMQLNHLSDQRFEPHLQSPFALWPQLSEILGVQSLVSKKMRTAGGFQFGSDDILLGIHGNNGFKIEGFLQIDSVLCILSTELEVISRDLLRSRWKRTGKAHLLFLTDLSKFVVPYWWQEASNELLCLH